MKISVITVCRNACGTIAHAVESFLRQDHPDKELLVLDGASTDGTQDIVARYAGDGVVMVSEPDRGMYDALNKGLARFSGEAFGALNADDAYHHDGVLTRIAEGLARTAIVHGDLDYVSDHATKRVVRAWRVDKARPAGGFRAGWMPAHPTFYVRRAVAERVGEFDLSLRTAADYDWMLRALEYHRFSVGRVEGVMVDMMHGGRSTQSVQSHLAHNLEALSSRRRWLNAPMVDRALVAKPLRKVSQFIVRREPPSV